MVKVGYIWRICNLEFPNLPVFVLDRLKLKLAFVQVMGLYQIKVNVEGRDPGILVSNSLGW